MQIGKNLRHLPQIALEQRLRKPGAGLDIGLQIITVHIIDDGIDTAVIRDKIVDLGQVRVRQILQNIHLCPQQEVLGIGAQKLLDHHMLLQTQVIGQIHQAGAAFSDGMQDLIGTVEDLIL